MIPNLNIWLSSAALKATTSSSKATALGYAHTYFDHSGIDLALLSNFPTNNDIHDAANDAFNEASSLFSICGILPQLLSPMIDQPLRLPGIHSLDSELFTDEADAEDSNDEFESITGIYELLRAADSQSLTGKLTYQEQNELVNMSCAAISISIDQSIDMLV